MFDLSMSTQKRRVKSLPEMDKVSSSSNYSYLNAEFWGEHCIECGVPYCYKSCKNFIPNPGGWCRRFKDGVVRVTLGNGIKAHSVQLLPWGKIGMPVKGRMMSKMAGKVFSFFDDIGCRIALFMARFCKVSFERRNPISYYRALRTRILLPLFSRTRMPERWIVECIVEKPLSLRCAISCGTSGEVFVRNLELKRGFNTFEMDVKGKPIGYYLISSIEGTEVPVYFTRLEVVSGGKGATIQRHAEYVKCVAWDLDNTLWKGIITEDGASGVEMRSEVVEAIKQLDGRGIVSTIVSKNDFDVAWKKLQAEGLDQYFVFPKINWMPKSVNIKQIAKDMNIGLDTFAFIDDSPNERKEVIANAGAVRVYDEHDVQKTISEMCFNPPVSAESSKRRLSYIAEMERKKQADGFSGSIEEFIRDSKLRLELMPLLTDEVKRRCWELVNRTNQLTLAARRYTENMFDEFVNRSGMQAYAIKADDKYGDYGIVGFAAIEIGEKKVELCEFVMSCRVAAKFCEQSVIAYFARYFADKGFTELNAKVVRTDRNMALINAFSVIPFKADSIDDKNILYSLPLVAGDPVPGLFVNPVVCESLKK